LRWKNKKKRPFTPKNRCKQIKNISSIAAPL